MSATAFYIPSSTSSSSSADIVALQTQTTALKADLGTPTSANTAGEIVKRDSTGGFSAGAIKATDLEAVGTTLTIAGQNNTSVVDIGKGTGVQAINLGNNGAGTTTISVGGGSDVVKVNLPLKDSAGTNVLHVVNGNCSVGPSAMPNVSATNNTSVGANAGAANVTGSGNTFIGFDSGKNGNGLNHNLNTAVGHSSLLAMTDARDNTAIGHASLNAVTTGNANTAIGKASGRGIITGGGNTFLGNYADSTVATITNSTAIGNTATVDASNMIQLGNTSVTAVKTSGTLYALGLESIGTTLDIAAQNNTSVVNIGKGTGVQTINVGNNGTGATVINLGGAGDMVNISGTLNNVTTTNTQVADKTLVLNSGGTASTAGLAGIYFEEAGSSANSYMRVSSDRSKIELKAPTGTPITLNQSLLTSDNTTFNSVFGKSLASFNVELTAFPSTGYAMMGWNRSGSSGRTLFATQQGGGTGGWEWLNYNNLYAPTSANPQMTLDRDGILTVSAGLRLPSTGGTASTLNHYEEYNFTTNFGGCASDSGIAISLVRLGKLVTLTIKSYSGVQATSPGYFSSVTAMPAQFRPTIEQYAQISIPTNAIGDEQGNGIMVITTGGIVRVGTAKYQGFAVGVYAGFQPLTVSWIL